MELRTKNYALFAYKFCLIFYQSEREREWERQMRTLWPGLMRGISVSVRPSVRPSSFAVVFLLNFS